MEAIKTKIVFHPSVARKLLKAGHKIVDIKPDKSDPTRNKSVYVFECTPEFDADLTEITKKINEHKDREAK